jgi:SAM-dependent methyltransferase
VQTDASRLPFPDASFDAIIASHSLEHFERLETALQELGRVVRPSGSIFIAVPDASTFSDRLHRWLGRDLMTSLAILNRKNLAGRYFGALHEELDTTTWRNVCVRCGSGCSSAWLEQLGIVKRNRFLIRWYASTT